MFSEFVEARAGESGRKGWALVISVAMQVVIVLLLLLVPILDTAALPHVWQGMRSMLAPAVPLVEAPKPPHEAVRVARHTERLITNGVIRAPSYIPRTIAIFQEEPLPPELPSPSAGYDAANLFNYLTETRSETAPPAPAAPVAIQRIHQTEIQPAMILSQPQPVYPSFARSTHIQGEVVLHAIIDREGRVAELQVVSGHPLLVKAALDAVAMWRYRPTMLNGQPVEVETTIRVSFVLGR